MSEEPQYLLPDPQKEVQRLTEQDAVITHLMGGRRILAPLDLATPGLRILDSGTADGLFLRAIQPLVAETCTLLGYDVMTSFFPPTTPPCTTLAMHDIAEPWPEELQGTIDLVHQRFTLPGGAKKATPRDMVGHLCRLVRPGGWIQLVEMDPTSEDAAAVHGPAMRDGWKATEAFLDASGAGTDYGKSMAAWLRQEGFQNVHDDRVMIPLGARCEQDEWGLRSANSLAESFAAVQMVCKMMNVDISPSTIENLPARAKEELISRGGVYPLVYAYAQKPTA